MFKVKARSWALTSITAIGTAGMVLALAVCGSASAKQLLPLRIVYNPNPTNTSIIVAQQQGFFRKDGLNVKLTSSAASTALLPAVGKQFDLVGAGPSSILQFAADGYHPVLVAAQTIENAGNKRNTYLLSSQGINSLQDLVGKKIGVAAIGGTQYEALLYELKQNGISPTSVSFLEVPFADMSSELTSGTIQAALAINPFAQSILAAGNKDLGNPISNALNNETALSIGWVASSAWARVHEQTILDFLKAQKQALAWMKTHLTAAQQILVTDFQLPAPAAAKYPIVQFVSFVPKASYLSDWVPVLKKIGVLKKTFKTPISSLIYNPKK